MVSSVDNSNASSNFGFSAATDIKKEGLGQQEFLRLMVAQVQNQDPLTPQANGEFLSQLAQFSTNDGITQMQKSIQQLATSLQSNQALQASALVGRKALVESHNLTLGTEGAANASINMVAGVTDLTASIYSEAGDLIKTIPLGQPAPGMFQFAWDGTGQDNQRAAAGKYRVEVHGTYEKKEVAFKTMTTANVDSVTLGQNGEGLKLNVAGVGALTLDEIIQIAV